MLLAPIDPVEITGDIRIRPSVLAKYFQEGSTLSLTTLCRRMTHYVAIQAQYCDSPLA